MPCLHLQRLTCTACSGMHASQMLQGVPGLQPHPWSGTAPVISSCGRRSGGRAYHAVRAGAGIRAAQGELLQHGHKGLRGGVHAHAAVPLPLRARHLALHHLPLPLREQLRGFLVLHRILYPE